MFNILLDDMPCDYMGHKIKTDFKQVFKFFAMQDDKDLTNQEKTILMISCFFEKPVYTQDFIDYIGYYIRQGEEPAEEDDGETIFSWNQDINYVFAAFMQVYKLDLTQAKMHWWKFLALYKGLPTGTKIGDIVQTRATPLPKAEKNNRAYVDSLRKLKLYYALDKKENEIGTQIQNIFGAI